MTTVRTALDALCAVLDRPLEARERVLRKRRRRLQHPPVAVSSISMPARANRSRSASPKPPSATRNKARLTPRCPQHSGNLTDEVEEEAITDRDGKKIDRKRRRASSSVSGGSGGGRQGSREESEGAGISRSGHWMSLVDIYKEGRLPRPGPGPGQIPARMLMP